MISGILSLFVSKSSIRFFYPVLVIVGVILIISVLTVIYKNKEPELDIKKEDFKIEKNNFIRSYDMIKQGKYSEYFDNMNNDVTNIKLESRHYRKSMKKFLKLSEKKDFRTKIMEKHNENLKNFYLNDLIKTYENIKDIKMNLIDDGVYNEWKQKIKH